ncbi:MAG TPA: DUF4118 domain-containing protein [Humisphaera sp.]|nr:DUF4118 domain-containing protein [Humisphaera sp.]
MEADIKDALRSALPVARPTQDEAEQIGRPPRGPRALPDWRISYPVALASTCLSLVVHLTLKKWGHDSGPFLFFAPAVMFSAWFGGTGPGLFATAVGAIAADWFILPPAGMFSILPEDVAKFGVFLVIGAQISWLSGALHSERIRAQRDALLAREGERLLAKARAALQVAHDHLETRVQDRTAELAFQKTLLEAQSNASVDGILVVSENARVIYANRRMAELWGLPPQAFGQNLADVLGAMREKLADRRAPLLSRSEDGAVPVDADATSNLALQDGRILECYSAPVRSADGTSYGKVWFFRDITERRKVARQIIEAGERERQRIGQDLHDDVCQHLAGITCLGRVLERELIDCNPAQAERAGRIVELIGQAIHRARSLSHGLQPVEFENAGLGTSLRELAATVESMFAVRCQFRGESSVPLNDAIAPIHLYRIAQEAINNAVRHGKAANIYIDLFNIEGRVIMSIEDDGVGIDLSVPPTGLGLRTMQTRARMIGGTLNVERGNERGTLVTCQLPLHEAGEHQ